MMYSVGFKAWVKVYLISMCIIGIILSGIGAMSFYKSGQPEYLLIVILPLITISILGLLHIAKFRLEVNEREVVYTGLFKTTAISFSEVRELLISSDHLILKSKHSKIKVSNDLKQQKAIMKEIHSKVETNPEAKIKGISNINF